MRYEDSLEYQLELRKFDYADVVDKLQHLGRELTSGEWGLLGISMFREGEFTKSIPVLERAAALGEIEAEIELQGARILSMQFDSALEELDRLIETTSGFAQVLALRWAGVGAGFTGSVVYGTGLLNQAYQLSQSLGCERGNQIVGVMLALGYMLQGKYDKAIVHLERAIKYFSPGVESGYYIYCCSKLFLAYGYANKIKEARDVIKLMHNEVGHTRKFYKVQIHMCEALLQRFKNDNWRFRQSLLKLAPLLAGKREHHIDALLWLGPPILDAVSGLGQHRTVLSLIHRMLPDRNSRPISLRVLEAVVLLRSGGYRMAVQYLEQTLMEVKESGLRFEAIRCELYLADALYKSGLPEKALGHLNEALRALGKTTLNWVLKDDLKALTSVLLYGESRAETAELLQTVRDQEVVPVQQGLWLRTFGALELIDNGRTYHWALNEQHVLLILCYLAMRPDHTVDQIAQDVLTEKFSVAPAAARSYVRQVILLLRAALGEDVILTIQPSVTRPARYRIGDGFTLNIDVQSAYDALADGDITGVFQFYQWRFANQSDSNFTREINSEMEGQLYHSLVKAFKTATTITELYQVEAWARTLLSLAPENDEVIGLIDQLDLALEVANSSVMTLAEGWGTSFNF